MDYLSQQAMQQKAGVTSVYSTAPTQQDVSVAPSGLSSAAKELAETIAETSRLAENLRSSLGISVPQSENPANGDGSFGGSIRQLRYQLERANGNLGDVLQHINN